MYLISSMDRSPASPLRAAAAIDFKSINLSYFNNLGNASSGPHEVPVRYFTRRPPPDSASRINYRNATVLGTPKRRPRTPALMAGMASWGYVDFSPAPPCLGGHFCSEGNADFRIKPVVNAGIVMGASAMVGHSNQSGTWRRSGRSGHRRPRHWRVQDASCLGIGTVMADDQFARRRAQPSGAIRAAQCWASDNYAYRRAMSTACIAPSPVACSFQRTLAR